MNTLYLLFLFLDRGTQYFRADVLELTRKSPADKLTTRHLLPTGIQSNALLIPLEFNPSLPPQILTRLHSIDSILLVLIMV